MKQLTNHVYLVEHQPEVDRPWIGYVKGEKESFVIDAGNSPAHAALIQGKLESRKFPLPSTIGITHSHWDHTYGLAGWEAAAFASQETCEILQKQTKWTWSEEEFLQHIETNEIPLFCKLHLLLEYPGLQEIQVQVPSNRILEKMRWDLGNVTVIGLPVVSPHTNDSVVYYVVEDKVLFIGDAYCEEVIGEDWIDRPELRASFIKSINEFDYEWCVTGHHGPLKREEFLQQFGG